MAIPEEIKQELEKYKSTPDETKTVYTSSQAETLQKSGWRLLDCKTVGTSPDGMTLKEYKFQKEAK